MNMLCAGNPLENQNTISKYLSIFVKREIALFEFHLIAPLLFALHTHLACEM